MGELRVLIVGCGNIAGRFDEARPSTEPPLTHAGAYVRDGRFKIVACVDPDGDRRSAFANAWKVPTAFGAIDAVSHEAGTYDVVSVCSPTECHAHDVEVALELRPKLIFCEKPVATSVAQTARLLEKCAGAGVALAVNYTRRWDPEVCRIQTDLRAGRLGPLRAAVAFYNKGILNNGSHMVDLLHMLIGPLKVLRAGKPVNDYLEGDPTIPVWLEGPNEVPIYLVGGYADDYAIFELQMIFSAGALAMEDNGMQWRERRAETSSKFIGYRALQSDVRTPGKYDRSMLRAVDNIHRAVSRGDALASSGETALEAQRVCETAMRLTDSYRSYNGTPA
jgi:predicted dehydrogenase